MHENASHMLPWNIAVGTLILPARNVFSNIWGLVFVRIKKDFGYPYIQGFGLFGWWQDETSFFSGPRRRPMQAPGHTERMCLSPHDKNLTLIIAVLLIWWDRIFLEEVHEAVVELFPMLYNIVIGLHFLRKWTINTNTSSGNNTPVKCFRLISLFVELKWEKKKGWKKS